MAAATHAADVSPPPIPKGDERALRLPPTRTLDLVRHDFNPLGNTVRTCETVAALTNAMKQAPENERPLWRALRQVILFTHKEWSALQKNTSVNEDEGALTLARDLTCNNRAVYALYEKNHEDLVAWAAITTTPDVAPYGGEEILERLRNEGFQGKRFYFFGPMLTSPTRHRLSDGAFDPVAELLQHLHNEIPDGVLLTLIAEKNTCSMLTFVNLGFDATEHTTHIDGACYRWYTASTHSFNQSPRHHEHTSKIGEACAFADDIGLRVPQEGGPILVAGSRALVTRLTREIAIAYPLRTVIGAIETHDHNVYQELDTDTRAPSARGKTRFIAMNFKYWHWHAHNYHESLTSPFSVPMGAPPFALFTPQAFDVVVTEGRPQGSATNGSLFPDQYWEYLNPRGDFIFVHTGENVDPQRCTPKAPPWAFDKAGRYTTPWHSHQLHSFCYKKTNIVPMGD